MEGVGVEWTDPFSIVSPKAVRTAAEYFLPLFVPTVVPSMSLKYDVPVDDTTGLPLGPLRALRARRSARGSPPKQSFCGAFPMCGSFMNDDSPRLTSANRSSISASVIWKSIISIFTSGILSYFQRLVSIVSPISRKSGPKARLQNGSSAQIAAAA